MCGLFLHPTSALLFNALHPEGAALDRLRDGRRADPALARPEGQPPQRRARDARRLAPGVRPGQPVRPGARSTRRAARRASTSTAGPARPPTSPRRRPTAVLIIHSFSAESPDDPETIAGRWLANGAFAYFGSMNEPFLQAFRPPGLVASFLAENLPVVAAVRRTPAEVGGQPWRLVYFGDPLYRVRPPSATPPAGSRRGRRSRRGPPTASSSSPAPRSPRTSGSTGP